MADTKGKYIYKIGRRKTSTATVRLYKSAGKSTINSKEVEKLYPSISVQSQLEMPFVVAGLNPKDYHYTAKAQGGGKMSQVGAIVLGIARSIIEENPETKKELKNKGLLIRDPRMVERKKAGLRKARKSEQYSKR